MSLKKIFQESPKRSTKNRQIENKNKTQAVIDEPTLFLDMDKLLAKYPNKEICGVKIDLRRINDKRYLVKKLYQIILDPDRPTDAASVQWRVNVIRCLENMLRTDFKNTRDFKRKIENNKWAEWAEVYGNFYGTSAEFLDTCLASGKHILLDIDVQGAIQIKNRYPDSVTIFIMPPSLETLRARLESRGTDTRQVIERRLKTAKKEMGEKNLYRHVIINDELSKAVSELVEIIGSYR